MILRGNCYTIRKRVPHRLQQIIGKNEIWRSLHTSDLNEALSNYSLIMARVDMELDHAKSIAGLIVEPTIDEPSRHGPINNGLHIIASQVAELIQPQKERGDSLTFAQAYERYMSDPTHSWSYKTRNAHAATSELAKSILGTEFPVNQITRAHCRDLINVLQRIPKNLKKQYPKMKIKEAVDKTWVDLGENERMSVANINAYLSRVASFFNWAVLEEIIDRNPITGMRLKDDVRKRDKRKPFSNGQLNKIFRTPLYTGCQDDKGGYYKVGIVRPKGSRFWIPLLGLFTGMRLNEICQLEVDDIDMDGNIPVIRVSLVSRGDGQEKSLKTKASDRVIPIHNFILELGFLSFVERKRQKEESNLFNDLVIDRNGFRSPAFSKWFVRFCEKANVKRPLTSFHSFRHNFRDALREAQVPRDIAHSIGGWTITSTVHEVADDYGSGYNIKTLNQAVQSIVYSDLDLSHLLGPKDCICV